MKQVPEFIKIKQGRPLAPSGIELETRQGYFTSTIIYLQEENVALKELLDKLLNEQIQKLEELRIELVQMKLHLASMSEADVSEDDVD